MGKNLSQDVGTFYSLIETFLHNGAFYEFKLLQEEDILTNFIYY